MYISHLTMLKEIFNYKYEKHYYINKWVLNIAAENLEEKPNKNKRTGNFQ